MGKCSHRYENGELARWFQNLQFGKVFIACRLCSENISELVKEENEKLKDKKSLTNVNNNDIIVIIT